MSESATIEISISEAVASGGFCEIGVLKNSENYSVQTQIEMVEKWS